MERSIALRGKEISYTLRKSARARQMRIAVGQGGAVVAVLPRRTALRTLEQFMHHKASWLLRTIAWQKAQPVPVRTEGEYKAHKEAARAVVESKLPHYAALYGVTYGRVTIRNQKSRWGSCSRSGNLNFNYRIAFLPERLQEYVMVHELCHRKEFNHSPRFWALVATYFPDHRALRAQLRNYVLNA